MKEHAHVMPAISREPATPSKLVDVIRCNCKAEGKVCSRCSYGSNGMSCTSYCVREGGMLVQPEGDEGDSQLSDYDIEKYYYCRRSNRSYYN